MSLKLKTALLFSSLLLAAVGGLSAILVRSATRALEREQAAQAQKRTAALAEVCRGTIFSHQDLHAANYLRELKRSSEVIEAYCLDKTGRVIGHSDVEKIGEPLTNTPSDPTSLAEEQPILLDGISLGLARIVFDRETLRRALAQEMSSARWRVWRLALPVIGLGFLGAFLLTGYLIKPLDHVVAGAQAIGGGALNHVIPVERRDEIGLLAEEVNRMAVKLASLDEMKRDFVNGVTHDLKSPLAGILAAAEAARGGDAAAREEQLAVVRQRAELLRDLIGSILEVAKIESGLVLNKKRVRLEELVDRSTDAHRGEAARKGLGLEHVMESALPEISVDETKIERALSNLVGNAVKFTDQGAVTVRTARDGAAALVRVEDTGPGVAPELKDRLFTKFSRAAKGAAAQKEGTGLGLAVAKGVVEAHGGHISVESAPGRTVFTVRLPLG